MKIENVITEKNAIWRWRITSIYTIFFYHNWKWVSILLDLAHKILYMRKVSCFNHILKATLDISR